MRNRPRGQIVLAAIISATSLLLTAPLRAQENDLPTYTVLDCRAGCVKVTDPALLDHHATFPEFEALLAQRGIEAEAYVELRYTVTAEGTVKDPVVEKLIGPDDFARYAVAAVKDWRYQPATANGVPVPRPNWGTVIIYRFSPKDTAARAEVFQAYARARSLLKDGRYDEAKAVLLPILALPRLNFYERSMISFALALNETALNDYLAAREYIADATIQKAGFVDAHAKADAIRMRIRLDSATGQLGDALAWFEILKQMADTPADDPEAKLVAQIKERLADPKPFAIGARIPPSGYNDSWDHILLRRNFAFGYITGNVDHFELRCDQQQIVSKISEKAEWQVPAGWSNCELSVFGAPGATFRVYEDNGSGEAKK
jgi:TonB family protein